MTDLKPQPPSLTPRGHLVHVDLRAPLPVVEVPDGAERTLVVVHDGPAVLGQVWFRGTRQLHPADLWMGISNGLGAIVARRRLKLTLEGALGRAPRDRNRADRTVSVIVCTRDRPDQLVPCLESLLRLARPGVDVLVVDNGSKDDSTARACAALGVRCISEPRPGQCRARNLGIAESTGDLVAYTDDDVVVDEHWLDGLDDVFDDPLTMVATGYIGPLELTGEGQLLFEAHGGFERHADRRVFDPSEIAPLSAAASVGAGANMVFRREVFDAVGGFPVDFGPGTPPRTSDDKLMFYRVLKAGYRIEYDPRRIVWHRHRKDRAALERIMRDHGTGEFSWTARCLMTDGDLDALRVWRWWLGHYVDDIRRVRHNALTAVPAWVTKNEIRGVLGAPKALLQAAAIARREPPAVLRRDTVSSPTRSVEARVVLDPPPITVTLASYNRRDRLRRALEALADQTQPRDRYEVMVVLDGSTDGSGEMVRSLDLPVTLRLIEQENQGLAVARNKGVAEAVHPFVLFMDDDIEASPELVRRHALRHATEPAPTFVMGYFPPVLDAGWWPQEVRRWWLDHFRRKGERDHRWTLYDLVDGNGSVPVALMQEIGGFDEDFTGGRRQDYELGIRLLQAGHALAFEPLALGTHHFQTSVRTALRNVRDEGRYDVLMAAKHPSVIPHLPFGSRVDPRAPMRRLVPLRSRWATPRAIDATARIADALERLRRRRSWSRVVRRGLADAYLQGVGEGIGRYGSDWLQAESVRSGERVRVRVPLDGPAVHVQPSAFGMQTLVLTDGDREIATVPDVLPGQQWDWESLLERSTGAALMPRAFLPETDRPPA